MPHAELVLGVPRGDKAHPRLCLCKGIAQKRILLETRN